MQRLRAVIAAKDGQTVAACLPPWAYIYNKLVMDNNRSALHIQPEADVQMPEHVPHFIMHTPDVIRAICVMLSPWLQIAIL